MGKQKKAKAKRRTQRKTAVAPTIQSWFDEKGLHFIGPGPAPQAGEEERLTETYQEQIRKSPLWSEMVDEFGEVEATVILRQFKVEVRK